MDPRTEQKLRAYLDQQDAERKREGMRAMLDDLNKQHPQDNTRVTLDGRALAKALAEQEPSTQPDRTARPPKK